ncbi:retrograde regulation protein 2 [Lithohypha guttulata]|nr:retrograde regulation protein 2 [Lithohypha guttulata]
MGGGPQAPDLSHRRNEVSSTSRIFNRNLHGIVDMGSNARILPTLYSYRLGISLYEAQYDDDGNQIPIPEDVQMSVIGAFLRFEIFCSDFGVPFENIRIIATEATRKALNGEEFVGRVAKETGLNVEILSQAGEGQTGAWGIASSASDVDGLVMDLGGGSTQITWMITTDGHMETSPKGAFSFPYGAAALTQRLQLIEKKAKSPEEAEAAKEALRKEMKDNFHRAYYGLEVPDELVKKAEREGGFTLFLSGGGFRGWGYILLYMAQKHKRAYPLSIINGFVARRKDFTDVRRLKKAAREADRIFRVSDRRRAQVPAVAFLVSVLAEVIPHGIKEANFCQGGVREGILFKDLPPEIRTQAPIEVATAPYARPLAPKLANLFYDSLPKQKPSRNAILALEEIEDGWTEIPSFESKKHIPDSLSIHILHGFANMIYVHADMSKELSSAAALYTTSSGVLADTHGTSHRNRAIMALLLDARYKGDLPPRDYNYREAMRRLLTPAEIWWINYLGAVALVLGRIYPAGGEDDLEGFDSDDEGEGVDPFTKTNELHRPHHKKPHLKLQACFAEDLGKDGEKPGIRLTFRLRMRESNKDDPMKVKESLEEYIKKIKKVGKKKNWVKTNRYHKEKLTAADDDWSSTDDEVEEQGQEDDDNDLGWGMKVKVEVKVEYPSAKDSGRATAV